MIFIGIAFAGMFAYNPASVRSRHRWVNLLDPGHQPLPIQHQLDILDGLIDWYFLLVKYNIEIQKISTNSHFFNTLNHKQFFFSWICSLYSVVHS